MLSNLIQMKPSMNINLICVILILWVSCQPKPEPQEITFERPNIVLIIADDMNWDDCGAYGHPHIKTPHIDALAAAGMRFDHAYVTASSCSP